MRIELVEKVGFAAALVAIVLVGGLVVTFTIVPKESGISREEVDATIAVDDWLENARAAAGGSAVRVGTLIAPPSAPGAGGSTSGKPGSGTSSAPPTSGTRPAERPDNYMETSGSVPLQERADPNVDWLRRQDGVAFMPPVKVPEILREKLQSFDDAFEVAQQGGGEFVAGRYRINWIQEDSYLATRLGLQPGDEVVSVNGQPIGNSLSAGRALYEQLKGERHFALKVVRGGGPVVLSFMTN